MSRSLRKTIEIVDTERLTALNVHDLAAWKSNTGAPEEFYFRSPSRLLFTLRIQSPTGVLNELSERDRDRFLDIDEAIRRYSRGTHGGLISQPEAEVFFEDPIELSFENSAL